MRLIGDVRADVRKGDVGWVEASDLLERGTKSDKTKSDNQVRARLCSRPSGQAPDLLLSQQPPLVDCDVHGTAGFPSVCRRREGWGMDQCYRWRHQ